MDNTDNQLDITVWFRDFVEANRGYFPTDHYQMLSSVAEMLKDFEIQASQDFLTIQRLEAQYDAQVEENESLRAEIRRLKGESN